MTSCVTELHGHPTLSRAQKVSTMLNQRQLVMFFSFYLYLLNMNETNDMRRVILLASLIQIRALQAQLLILYYRRIRMQRRRLHGRRRPRFWVLPRPDRSWFDVHFHDLAIPDDYFRRQLRLNCKL